jgi:hypothetical protein
MKVRPKLAIKMPHIKVKSNHKVFHSKSIMFKNTCIFQLNLVAGSLLDEFKSCPGIKSIGFHGTRKGFGFNGSFDMTGEKIDDLSEHQVLSRLNAICGIGFDSIFLLRQFEDIIDPETELPFKNLHAWTFKDDVMKKLGPEHCKKLYWSLSEYYRGEQSVRYM